MSHQACQSLGFSRANETILVYDTDSLSSNDKRFAEAFDEHRNLRPTSSSANLNLMPDFYSSSVGEETEMSGGDQVIDELIADMDTARSLGSQNSVAALPIKSSLSADQTRSAVAQTDHHVLVLNREHLHEQTDSSAGEKDHLTKTGLGEIKFKSLSSLLYHGSQVGCENQLVHPISHVYLQCLNFQCGRSVTSYSSRVKLQHFHLPRAADESQRQVRSSVSAGLRSLVVPADAVESNGTCHLHNVPAQTGSHQEPALVNGITNGSIESDGLSVHIGDSTANEFDTEPAYLDQWILTDAEALPFSSQVSSRLVVGGFESMPGEFPYLAALHGGPDEVFFCGGVLISINWLLTAAHCVGNRTQPEGWMVKVGVTRRIASPAFVKKLKVRRIIKHQDFNKDNLFNNDIALILLEDPVEFNQFLRPVCLPMANLKLGPDNSKDCVVVGFGKPKFSQEANYLHVAHFVNVPIVRHSICSDWYADHNVSLTEGMLCAGYAEGKRDACQVRVSRV